MIPGVRQNLQGTLWCHTINTLRLAGTIVQVNVQDIFVVKSRQNNWFGHLTKKAIPKTEKRCFLIGAF